VSRVVHNVTKLTFETRFEGAVFDVEFYSKQTAQTDHKTEVILWAREFPPHRCQGPLSETVQPNASEKIEKKTTNQLWKLIVGA
jgi:hypothetical protein